MSNDIVEFRMKCVDGEAFIEAYTEISNMYISCHVGSSIEGLLETIKYAETVVLREYYKYNLEQLGEEFK